MLAGAKPSPGIVVCSPMQLTIFGAARFAVGAAEIERPRSKAGEQRELPPTRDVKKREPRCESTPASSH